MTRRGRKLVRHLALPLLATACLAQVVVPLARIATSYRATELDLSASQILALSSGFAILPAFLAVGMGRYNDINGAGRSAVGGSVLLVVCCAMLLAPVDSLWWLLAVSVVAGLGQTLQLTALQGEVAMFRRPRHREGMIGGLMLWQAVGQIVAPLLLSGIAFTGGNLTFRLALAGLVLSVVCALLSILLWRYAAMPVSADKKPACMRRILSTPGLAWVMLAGSLCVAVHDLMLIYLPVVGADRSIPATQVGLLLALFACGQMISRALYSRVVRRTGPRLLILGGVIATAALTAMIALPLGVIEIGALLAAIGVSMGFAITASVSLTMALAPPSSRSTSLGLRLSLNRAGQFLIPLAASGAAVALGPGAVFVVLGSALGGVGVYGGKALAKSG